MLEEFVVFPFFLRLLIFLINFRRSKDIREEIFLDIRLLIHKLLLLNREEPSLADMHCVHQLLYQPMQISGGVDIPKVNQSIHDMFHLLFILQAQKNFFFQHLDEVVFFEWGTFLNLPLLSHLFLCLLVALPPRFLGSLRESRLWWSTWCAWLLGFWVLWGSRHWHLVSVETYAVFVEHVHSWRHALFVVLDYL